MTRTISPSPPSTARLRTVPSDSRRLGVSGRVLRLGYFTSQPTGLLTAVCANGDRVDLLVIAPDTDTATADAAMVVAATASNLVHARHILRTVTTASPKQAESVGG
jgi:hypothetical protein